MSNYPAGAWEDPKAPWNEQDEVLCPACGEEVEQSMNNHWREAKCIECGWELDYFLE